MIPPLNLQDLRHSREPLRFLSLLPLACVSESLDRLDGGSDPQEREITNDLFNISIVSPRNEEQISYVSHTLQKISTLYILLTFIYFPRVERTFFF